MGTENNTRFITAPLCIFLFSMFYNFVFAFSTEFELLTDFASFVPPLMHFIYKESIFYEISCNPEPFLGSLAQNRVTFSSHHNKLPLILNE